MGLRAGVAVLCVCVDCPQQELSLQHWLVGIYVSSGCLRDVYLPAGEGVAVAILPGAWNGASVYLFSYLGNLLQLTLSLSADLLHRCHVAVDRRVGWNGQGRRFWEAVLRSVSG